MDSDNGALNASSHAGATFPARSSPSALRHSSVTSFVILGSLRCNVTAHNPVLKWFAFRSPLERTFQNMNDATDAGTIIRALDTTYSFGR